MSPILKKAFQLNKDDIDIQQLNYLNSKIKVSSAILFAAKTEMTEYLTTRNLLINSILLNRYEYIITPTDSVAYLDQTNKILIYDGKGPDLEQDYGKIIT